MGTRSSSSGGPTEGRKARPHVVAGTGLLEALITLAVGMALASQALPALRDQLNLWRLEGASAEVGRMLRLARQHAAMQRTSLRLEVGAGSGPGGCLVLHTGPQLGCKGCVGPAVCGSDAQLIARSAPMPPGVALQSTTASLLWSPASGTVTPTGTFRLSLTSSPAGATAPEVLHVVNLLGRARSCSNDPRIRLHAAC